MTTWPNPPTCSFIPTCSHQIETCGGQHKRHLWIQRRSLRKGFRVTTSSQLNNRSTDTTCRPTWTTARGSVIPGSDSHVSTVGSGAGFAPAYKRVAVYCWNGESLVGCTSWRTTGCTSLLIKAWFGKKIWQKYNNTIIIRGFRRKKDEGPNNIVDNHRVKMATIAPAPKKLRLVRENNFDTKNAKLFSAKKRRTSDKQNVDYHIRSLITVCENHVRPDVS